MAEKATIARPYARAAFAHARASNSLAAWSEALAMTSAIISDIRVKRLIGNPQVPVTQLIDFIADILGAKLNSDGRNFLEELARNRRLALLPEVAAMFESLRAEVENVADVKVTSAVALSDAQRDRIAKALKTRLQKDVRLHCEVDASLVGGAVIRSGDLVIDGSLRAQLERLSSAIAN